MASDTRTSVSSPTELPENPYPVVALDSPDALNATLDDSITTDPHTVDLEDEEEFQKNAPMLRYIAASFLVLFASFLTTQNLVSKLFQNVGLISLCLVYFTFMISALFAPIVVEKLGIRLALTCCAGVYVAWVASTIPGIDWLFLIMSAILGFAGAPLWVAQGIYVNALAEGKNLGRYNGQFLGIFFTNGIIGNLIIGILMATRPSNGDPAAAATTTTFVLVVLTVIACASAVMFAFLKVPESYIPDSNSLSVQDRLMAVFEMAKDRRALFFMPVMFYLGFFVTFSWGQLPKFVSLEAVPWMFIGYGIALLTGSFGSGRAFDRFGWKPLMLINCILMVIAFAAVPFGDSTKTVWPFFLATFCMGMCEAIQNCVQQSTLMMYFSGNINPILSIFRCVTAAGTSVGFLLPLVLNYVYLELVILGLMVIGVGLFAYHETKFGGSTSYSVEETQATPPVI